MKKHSLAAKGLSMTQAQSISNLCNQLCQEIDAKIKIINNFSAEYKWQNTTFVDTEGHPMPADIVELIINKAKYRGVQAFLMENIKAKEALMEEAKYRHFFYEEIAPREEYVEEVDLRHTIIEKWGWAQLSATETNEFYEQEALAAHIGQFIHKSGKLAGLRKELPTIAGVKYISMEEGKKMPIKVVKHHKSSKLFEIHTGLSEKHRVAEQRVNYFKAKVKNLTQSENVRIEKSNASLLNKYNDACQKQSQEFNGKMQNWRNKKMEVFKLWEAEKTEEISKLSALKIVVDPRFQEVVDEFLKKVDEK